MAFVQVAKSNILGFMGTDGIATYFNDKFRGNDDGWRAIVHDKTKHAHENIRAMGIRKAWYKEDEFEEVNIYGFFNDITWGGEVQTFVDDEHVANPTAHTLEDFKNGHVYVRMARRKNSYRCSCAMCDVRIGFEIWHNRIDIMSITENDEWTEEVCDPVNLVQFNIPVPSGELVYGDFIGSFKGEDGFETGNADINTHTGQVQAVLHNAARDMAAFSVGNSCPGLYSSESGKYIVASGMNVSIEDIADEYYMSKEQAEADGGEYSPEVEEYVREVEKLQETFGTIKREGGICTDLWWSSFMDKSLAEQYLEEDTGRWEEPLKVQPGMYQFSYYAVMSPWCKDNDYSRVYATFERIGDL